MKRKRGRYWVWALACGGLMLAFLALRNGRSWSDVSDGAIGQGESEHEIGRVAASVAASPAVAAPAVPAVQATPALQVEDASVERVEFDAESGRGRRIRLERNESSGLPIQSVAQFARDEATGEETTLSLVEMAADRILVRLRDGVSPDVAERIAQRLGGTVRRRVGSGPLFEIVFPTARLGLVEDRLAELSESRSLASLVAYSEPNYIVHAMLTPNDPSFADGSLWGLRNDGQNGGLAGVDIGAVAAWDRRASAVDIVVGVIDTGVNYLHEDLAANMWVNEGEIPSNGIDDDANGYVDDVHGINAAADTGDPFDDNGHGTHCAGTIGAVGNNGVGVVGVAWETRLMALKFLGSDGSGSVADAIACIDYAVTHGADILSNSWGGGGFSQSLAEAIGRASDAGVAFIAAAGNEARNTDERPNYPSGYDVGNVVSVAAIDRSGALAAYSNFGPETVDIAAPGSAITSCWIGGASAYKTISGTSMATPHVSGTLALVMSEYPDDSLADNLTRLLAGATQVDNLTAVTVTGGRANVDTSLSFVSVPRLPAFTQKPKPLYVVADGSRFELDVSAASELPVTYSWTRDGETLPNPSGGILALETVGPGDAGDYRVVATNDDGGRSAAFEIRVVAARADLAEAVDSDGYPFFTYGDANWSVYEFDAVAGSVSARSGTVGDDQSSSLFVELQGPGTASFQWRKSSEDFYDNGVFTVDGSVKATLQRSASWRLVSVELDEAKPYRLEWTYAKDYVKAVGQDALFVDDFRFTPRAGQPPNIVRQPQGAIVTPNESYELSVFATGDDLSYQWFRNGVALSGEVASALALNDVNEASIGTYYVEISNGNGTTKSSEASVAVELVQVSLLRSPSSVSVQSGASVRLEATFAGSWPLAYQWFYDGLPIDGASEPVLTLENISVSQAGRYRVEASNFNGNYRAVSSEAVVSVEEVRIGPKIVRDPESGYWQEGEQVVLSAGVEGSQPLAYQWFKDGEPIDGATERSLLFDPILGDDTGSYELVVSNAEGSARSSPASVFVVHDLDGALDWEGLEWEFDGPVYYFAQTAVTRDGEDALESRMVSSFLPVYSSMATQIEGPVNLSLYWKQDTNFIVSNVFLLVDDVVESSIQTVSDWRIARARIGPGVHKVSIEGMYESGGVTWLDQLSLDAVPAIYRQPESVLVRTGSGETLVVDAYGAGEISYQWFRDGVLVEGATGPSLELSGSPEAIVGDYQVVVTNAHGQAVSDIAVVESLESLSQEIGDGTVSVDLGVSENAWKPYRLEDGNVVLRSDAPAGGAESAFELEVEGPTNLLFDAAVQADGCCSSLRVTLNDVFAMFVSEVQPMGSIPILKPRAFAIPAGVNRVRFSFEPGSISVAGTSRAFVDNVRATTAPAFTLQPRSARVTERGTVSLSADTVSSALNTYQWFKDSEAIVGATGKSLTIRNASESDDAAYFCRATGPDGQTTDSLLAQVTVILGFYDAVELPVGLFRSGSENWRPQSEVTRDGSDALEWAYSRSANTNALLLDIDFGLGQRRAIAFWIRVDGLGPGAEIRFFGNNRLDSAIASDCDWTRVVVPLGKSGLNSVFWSILPGPAIGGSSLKVWLDEIEIIEAPVVYAEPISKVGVYGSTQSVTADVSGVAPMSYEWRRDGDPVAVSSSASAVSVHEVSSSFNSVGQYRLAAVNAAGATVSREAAVGLVKSDFGAAVGAPGRVTTWGAPLWTRVETGGVKGDAALRVGGVGLGEWSEARIHLNGAGTLSFNWRLDSPTDRERLFCYINDVMVYGLFSSGDWKDFSFELPEYGAYEVRVRFENLAASEGPLGSGWLDNVRFGGATGARRYSDWVVEAFAATPDTPEELRVWDADPDGDGLLNYAEYALLGDPLAEDAVAAPEFLFLNGRRAIQWSGRIDLLAEDVLILLEVSSDLESWHPASGVTSLDEEDPSLAQLITIVPEADGDRDLFAQLSVFYLDGPE